MTRIICLANSRKHGAHCVAGIEPTTKKWIRPISHLDDGRIERSKRLIKGRDPQLGDLLSIPLAKTGPDFGFESENLSLLPGAWALEGRLSPADILPYCSRERLILHNSENYVTVQFLQYLPFEQRSTLQLVEAFEFNTYSTGLSASGGHKWKASFVSKYGERLALMITDPVLVEKLETGYQPLPHCLVTVSLSMPWKPEEWEEEGDPCWKLVAGVIEIPSDAASEYKEMSCIDTMSMPTRRKPTEEKAPLEIDDAELTEALRKVFGFHSFLPDQKDIIRAILNKRDAFVVMPTGGGKSLCYQLPAHLLPGTCMVVSPLISLMKDQVDAAADNGLRAAYLNSSQSDRERVEVIRKLSSGNLDLIYMAPERFALETFLNNLKRVPLCLAAIDEAHCISEWGHDFRPDYLLLSEIVNQFPDIPVAAFTATATDRVQKDIIGKLCLRNPYTVRASFNRPNLFYQVLPKENVYNQIIDFIKIHAGQSGIVYRTTRKNVEDTVEILCEHGIKASPYHAGLDDKTRGNNQEAFNRDEVNIIVATIAFGMGIDKSNIRFVLHGDLPKNMESYYQETGRAGRDGEPAHCLLFFGRGDIFKIRYFINQMTDESEKRHALESLNKMASYAGVNACRRRQILAYFGESYPQNNCDACDICAGNVERVKASKDAQTVLSAIARTGEYFGAAHIVDIISGANTKKIRNLHHNEIKNYGVGKDKGKRHWRRIIDNLIAQKCITQTEGQYPVLRLGQMARAVLRGEKDVYVLRQKETPIPQCRSYVEMYDTDLFEQLRVLRRQLAAKQNVPPYIVFSDRTLHEMAHYFPTSKVEMLRITGVGQNKLEKYGRTFIQVIKEYKNAHSEIVQRITSGSPQVTTPVKVTASTITETVEETWALIKKDLTREEIAAQRNLTIGTITSHMERLMLAGRDIDIDVHIPKEIRMQIEELFLRLNTELLTNIVNASKDKIRYDDTRLVRAWMKRKRSTKQLFGNTYEVENSLPDYVQKTRLTHARAYAKWTPEEDDKLKKEFSAGHTIAELSKMFPRNRGSIRSRLKKLGELR